MNYEFETLSQAHGKAAIDIFNYYIENSFAAFRVDKLGYGEFERFLEAIGDYPAVAVKSETGETVGFGFLSPYRKVETFRRTATITYFILPEHTGKGMGTKILTHFIEKAKERDIDFFLASISSLNEQSIAFHEKHGFVECGRFKEIGVKLGKSFDIVWMQMKL